MSTCLPRPWASCCGKRGRINDKYGPRQLKSKSRIAAWIWLALLIVGSLQPARPGILRGGHRPIHYVAFAGAALLLLASSYTRRQEILCAVGIFFLGISLEFLQHLIYRNPVEWRDIGDDGFAIVVGFGIYYLTGSWKPASDSRRQ